MKKHLLLMLCCFLALSQAATAQSNEKNKGTISGTVQDGNKEALQNVALRLYSLPDTAYVTAVSSDADGKFKLSAAAGDYLLRFSFVGLLPLEKTVTLQNKKNVDLGVVTMADDVVALKEAVVTAEVPPVTMSEDTVVYNTAAFRVPAGSMLEDLIKKYPGVEISDDGTIKINGKTVTQILMKGKDFFGTDKEVALKNVPVDVVDKVKFYDKQSDFSRLTGIDDGEETAVLDLQMKKGADQGFFGNIDLAYGNKDRYSAKAMTNYFTSAQQLSLLMSANNVGDRGFSRGGGGSGLQAPKMAGFNFATTSDKLETGGHINYRHNDTDSKRYSSSEYFMTAGNSNQFSNSRSNSFSRSSSVGGNFKLEWKPDTLTNIIFTPGVSYSTSDSWSQSTSATFNDNPFEHGVDYPMTRFGDVPEELRDIAINSNNNESMSHSESKSVNGNLQINRRLGKAGRNITFRGGFAYSESESESMSTSEVKYYQADAGSSGYSRKRYSTTPNTNWNYDLRLSYSEPILKNLFLQLSYRFNYSYQNSDRSTYIFDDIENYTPVLNSNYSMPYLPDGYEAYLDEDQSRFSIYRNMRHEAELSFRYVTSKMNLNAGVTWMPQNSQMTYKYLQIDTVLKRTVYNFTPSVRFRYKWDKTTTLNVHYRGRTSQPSMTDLLDVTDDTDPMNIRKGNPGLKPSFTNTLFARFNHNNIDTQTGIMANVSFQNTLNSISNKVTYNETTGARTSQPENINGNWSVNGGFDFNSALPKNKKFTYSTGTNVGWQNQVSYISVNRSNSERNTTKTLNLGERLNFAYRNDVFDVTLSGSVNYSHSRNELQPESNLDTWLFSYGPSGNVTLPWQNIQLSTDIKMSSRRGFSDPTFNTNELLWNAQASMSMLNKNALTLTFQVYDILHEQSNVSRTINATMRSDSQTNAINSYCMLHVIYKFNQMGDKNVREEMRDSMRRSGYDGPPMHGGGGFGGMRMLRGPM